MALIGSTGATFFLSQYLNEGKFDVVHVQNSTLAGGVAIGATARLAMGPGVAFLVGLAAGLISVLGYFYSSPFLESKFGIYDTCGVGNLHGYPSVLGGLLSILLVFVDPDADFLNFGVGTQSIMQLAAVAATLVSSIVTGYLSGAVISNNLLGSFAEEYAISHDYDDAVWWTDIDD
jgi:ammonium transporter Rh